MFRFTLITMDTLVDAVYIWDSRNKIKTKKNIDFGNALVVFFTLWFTALFLYVMAKVLYPTMLKLEKQTIESPSGLLSFIRTLTHYWWSGLILLIFSLIVISVLSLVIAQLKPDRIWAYIVYFRHELRDKKPVTKMLLVVKTLSILLAYSFVTFLVVEILTIVSMFFVFGLILPPLFNSTKIILTVTFTIGVFVHVVVVPLLLLVYNNYINKKASIAEEIDLKEFMDESGEIDFKKWRARTWGKKPYSYDWKNEEYIPIICPSCGSVISSNLIVCPICKTNLEEEIKLLQDEEITGEEEPEKDETSEKNSSIGKTEDSKENESS